MSSIIEAVNQLWYNSILDLDIDFLNQKIGFKTISIDNGIKKYHSVNISFFSELMWISWQNDVTLNECKYLEMTSISECDIKLSSKNKWISQFENQFNLAIEIWSKVLLINAERITIDGIDYILKE